MQKKKRDFNFEKEPKWGSTKKLQAATSRERESRSQRRLGEREKVRERERERESNSVYI